MTALMTRREALAALTGGATAILTGAEATAQVAEPEGCLIKAEHLAALGWNRASFARHRPGDPLRTGTGDRALDRALGHALTKISKMFGQNPAFGFFDDSSRPNAYAYSGTIVQGTRGTVGFGRTLFRRLLGGFNDGGVSVMAVIAHEFGHIAQFGARSTYQELRSAHRTVKFVELHADLLAGYFVGKRRREVPNLPVIAVLEQMYSIGDLDFNNPNHHGTPEERVRATKSGYDMGMGGRSFPYAFSKGAEKVLMSFS